MWQITILIFLSPNNGCLAYMDALETNLPVFRVDAVRVAAWFMAINVFLTKPYSCNFVYTVHRGLKAALGVWRPLYSRI